MSRKLRYLRIAFSITCGIACVLLVVLWVQSYWRLDAVYGSLHGDAFIIHSMEGLVRLMFEQNFSPKFTIESDSVESWRALDGAGLTLPRSVAGFGAYVSKEHFAVMAPHWAGALLFSLLAALPWLPWRFSLRILLIATTLVAVALVLIIYTSR